MPRPRLDLLEDLEREMQVGYTFSVFLPFDFSATAVPQ